MYNNEDELEIVALIVARALWVYSWWQIIQYTGNLAAEDKRLQFNSASSPGMTHQRLDVLTLLTLISVSASVLAVEMLSKYNIM